jgi:hypothetical protein
MDACGPPPQDADFEEQCDLMTLACRDPLDPSCTCPGDGATSLPLNEPVRDPLAYGVIGLFQVKVDDFKVHAAFGDSCHFGTNCGITSKNGEEGVMNSSKAIYPLGSQVVAGLTKWRARGGTAGLADQVFSNFWVGATGDGVCIAAGGRQLWCPPLLDAYAGGSETVAPRASCSDDIPCDEPGPIEDLWDDEIVAEADAVAMHTDMLQDVACRGLVGTCVDGPGMPNTIFPCKCQASLTSCPGGTCVLGDEFDGQPDGHACFAKVTLPKNTTLAVEQGEYVICEATFGDKSIVRLPSDANGNPEPVTTGVTIYASKFTVQDDVRFFWTDIDVPNGSGGLSTSLCDDVRVGVFEGGSNVALKFGPRAKVSGTFFAPQLTVQPGTNSSINGRVIARVFEGHPGSFYCCRCRPPGEACDAAGDCCDGGQCTAGICERP